MAKKTVIKEETPAPGPVIGLSSGEKIWKLVWEINRGLEIRLTLPVNAGTEETIYSDTDSPGDWDYFLMESVNSSKKIPKQAREFRYWLFLTPRESKTEFSGETLIRKLKGLPHIALVADLTGSLYLNDWLT